jgi:hypothetical protein
MSLQYNRIWQHTCIAYLLHGAEAFASSQEIPRILWNPKVHYLIYNGQPPASILSQPNPVHIPTSHFLKARLNIILSSMPGSIQWSLSVRFPY